MVGSINEGDHKILLHTKYLSYGPNGFREEDFLSCLFSINKFKGMATLDPWGRASLDPRCLIGTIYVGDH